MTESKPLSIADRIKMFEPAKTSSTQSQTFTKAPQTTSTLTTKPLQSTQVNNAKPVIPSNDELETTGMSIKDRMKMFDKPKKTETPILSSKPIKTTTVQDTPISTQTIEIKNATVLPEHKEKIEPEPIHHEIQKPQESEPEKKEEIVEAVQQEEENTSQEVANNQVGSEQVVQEEKQQEKIEDNYEVIEEKQQEEAIIPHHENHEHHQIAEELTKEEVLQKEEEIIQPEIKQIENITELPHEEVKEVEEKPRKLFEETPTGSTKGDTLTSITPSSHRNSAFASNLDSLLGKKGQHSSNEPIKRAESCGSASQDSYTDAILSKPVTPSMKKRQSKLEFIDEDDFN